MHLQFSLNCLPRLSGRRAHHGARADAGKDAADKEDACDDDDDDKEHLAVVSAAAGAAGAAATADLRCCNGADVACAGEGDGGGA